ncbi:hypothetical protein BB560_002474 [Smittium megazygosporum]|uniref:SPX domain-containing protein n=1 Tax=Smittium megazygosporum TaxID=133381 RepID=A0A2T9ZEU2_9FUNG|nr:hypothetical protein BB560_002474 [Smittium megazygosporum]
MKFGKYLESEAVPEWQTEYIDYKGLKKLIKKIVNRLNNTLNLSENFNDLSEEYMHASQRLNPLAGSSSSKGVVQFFDIHGPTALDSPVPKNQRQSIHSVPPELPIGLSRSYTTTKLRSSGNSSLYKSPFPASTNKLYHSISAEPRSSLPPNKASIDNRIFRADSHGISVSPENNHVHFIETVDKNHLKPRYLLSHYSDRLNSRDYTNQNRSTNHNEARGSPVKNLSHFYGKNNSYKKSLPSALVNEINQTEGFDITRKKSSTRYNPNSTELSYASFNEFRRVLHYRLIEEQAFFEYCDTQLKKVNGFFKQKETLFLERFLEVLAQQKLLDQIVLPEEFGYYSIITTFFFQFAKIYFATLLKETIDHGTSQNNSFGTKTLINMNKELELTPADYHIRKNDTEKAKRRLKKAIKEIYRGFEMLKSFRVLNKTGFVKILKKYTKATGWEAGPASFLEFVDTNYFVTSTKLDTAIRDIEKVYADRYSGGLISQARNELRIPSTISDVINGFILLI